MLIGITSTKSAEDYTERQDSPSACRKINSAEGAVHTT